MLLCIYCINTKLKTVIQRSGLKDGLGLLDSMIILRRPTENHRMFDIGLICRAKLNCRGVKLGFSFNDHFKKTYRKSSQSPVRIRRRIKAVCFMINRKPDLATRVYKIRYISANMIAIDLKYLHAVSYSNKHLSNKISLKNIAWFESY